MKSSTVLGFILACAPAPAPQSVVVEPLPPSPASSSPDAQQRDLQTPPPPPHAIVTVSGLGIEDLRVGTGAEAVSGRDVTVHYVGTLPSGKEFDSSRTRGAPLTFRLGAGHLIKGWEEGLVGMRVGGLRRLTIPPDLAYGAAGVSGSGIGPNETLLFEIELLDVK